MIADLSDIVSRLEAISEELAELGIGCLRRAIDSGDKNSLAERRIAQARRSVDKAAFILAGLDGDRSDS